MAERRLRPAVQRRLRAASRRLARKEIEISEILNLRVRPRLTLLDEASAVRATCRERDRLDAEDDDAGPRPQ